MLFQSLGWEDPLEEGMATDSSILVWRTPWTEEPSGVQSMGSQRGTRWKQLSTYSPILRGREDEQKENKSCFVSKKLFKDKLFIF